MSAQRWKKWLRRKLNRYSPDAALRWIYRLAFRKGHKRGYEKGYKEGQESVPPILNRCMMHNMPTYPRIVQLADMRWVEVWCCPRWDAHIKDMSVQQFPDVEAHTDKVPSTATQQLPGRFSAAVHQALQQGAGVNTAISRAIPKQPHPTVKLSPDRERR